MKLYATTTSERASKGQGGNEWIEIELSAGEKGNIIGYIFLDLHKDSEKDSRADDEWVLSYTCDREIDPEIILQGYIKGNKEKGKKQQGELQKGWTNADHEAFDNANNA